MVADRDVVVHAVVPGARIVARAGVRDRVVRDDVRDDAGGAGVARDDIRVVASGVVRDDT